MKKTHKKIRIGVFSVLLLSVIIVFVYNVLTNDNFFDANISSILSVLTVIFISYYLTQARNDERKQIESIERLILKIQSEIVSDKILNNVIQENNPLLNQRSIANKIEYIKKLGIKKIESDINYIDAEYTALRELYSNHMAEPDYLEKLGIDFRRHVVNISDRCDMILVELTK